MKSLQLDNDGELLPTCTGKTYPPSLFFIGKISPRREIEKLKKIWFWRFSIIRREEKKSKNRQIPISGFWCVAKYIWKDYKRLVLHIQFRVDRPITNLLPMTEHLFTSSSYVLHFEWFKMLGEHYLKLEKSSLKCKEKRIRKIKSFPTYITCFLFSSLWTPPAFKYHNFLISYSFKKIWSAMEVSL
jgi:hypothetical protein